MKKSIYKSKTVWGAVIVGLGLGAESLGFGFGKELLAIGLPLMGIGYRDAMDQE